MRRSRWSRNGSSHERLRLDKDTETDETQVTEEVRKEEIHQAGWTRSTCPGVVVGSYAGPAVARTARCLCSP